MQFETDFAAKEVARLRFALESGEQFLRDTWDHGGAAIKAKKRCDKEKKVARRGRTWGLLVSIRGSRATIDRRPWQKIMKVLREVVVRAMEEVAFSVDRSTIGSFSAHTCQPRRRRRWRRGSRHVRKPRRMV